MIRSVHRRNWILLVAIAWTASVGCGGKVRTVKPTMTRAESDTTLLQVARLDTEPTAEACREVLQALDAAATTRENRPKLGDDERKTLSELVPLTPLDRQEIESEKFTALDPFHVEECLLLRDAVRSLNVTNAPDLKKATLAFEWVCRQIYLEQRGLPAVPPWYSLEGGTGTHLDRAYVFLGLLQQMNLDGCLVAPPTILTTPVVRDENRKEGLQRSYTPIRAVGVRIGKDLFLFDPLRGKPIPDADGKGIATLTQVRGRPELAKEWKSEEIKLWEPFLAVPLSGLAARMTWLEGIVSESIPVKLHWNVAELHDRILKETGEKQCRFWNPPVADPNDLSFEFTATRIQRRFHLEQKLPGIGGLPPLQAVYVAEYAKEYIPLKFRPILVLRDPNRPELRTRVDGPAQAWVDQIYAEPIRDLFFRFGSPRDRILRGRFNDANLALSRMQDDQDGIRVQANEIPNLNKQFEAWAEQGKRVYSDEALALGSRDATAIEAAQAQRMNWQKNGDMLLLILREAGKVKRGEIAYLTAVCAHEKAERLQGTWDVKPSAELKTEAAMMWGNARDYWEAYLNNFPELRSLYPARDAHAKKMKDRCERFLGKSG